MKKRHTHLPIYILLVLGSLIFALPLVWMISTAVKPIEQTMSMPPRWLPYQWYEKTDKSLKPVRRGPNIVTPSLLVRRAHGEKAIIPMTRKPAATDIILKTIPASTRHPWVKLSPATTLNSHAGVSREWWVAPAGTLQWHYSARWGNFVRSLKAMKYFPAYLTNTLILCILTVLGAVCSSAFAAYGFSRIQWPGRDRLFMYLLATMMIPFPVVMVPLYVLFRDLGWIGSLKPLWVPTFFAGAFNVFLLRQFFMTIPRDLSEAAKIDGASEFRIFLQIIIPLSKPALMVVGLFQFMATWNDFLGPLIYLTRQKDYTLALGLQFFQSQHGGTQWNYLMAASAVVIAPIIILFFFTQRTFVEGISLSGIKG